MKNTLQPRHLNEQMNPNDTVASFKLATTTANFNIEVQQLQAMDLTNDKLVSGRYQQSSQNQKDIDLNLTNN